MVTKTTRAIAILGPRTGTVAFGEITKPWPSREKMEGYTHPNPFPPASVSFQCHSLAKHNQKPKGKGAHLMQLVHAKEWRAGWEKMENKPGRANGDYLAHPQSLPQIKLPPSLT